MLDVLYLIFLTFLVILVSIWQLQRKRGRKYLPGPFGLPFVGYIPFLTKKPYIKLQQLQKVYGPMYKVKLGSQNIAVLCDFESIKEAFASDAFMGRPPNLPFDPSEESIRTGAFLDLPWKEQRRFFLHRLRDLGFGKTRMEEHMKEEIQELLQRFEDLNGSPVKVSGILAPSTSNNIASFIFGNRLKHDDPKRVRLDKLLNEVGQLAGSLTWQIFFPWIEAFMKYLQIGKRAQLSRALAELRDFCSDEVKAHEKTLDPNNIRDIMDSYLLEIEKRSSDPNTGFQKDVLYDLARGFFVAGSDTVRVTVDWMLLICAAYPEVQKKIHGEIEEILGSDRFPTRSDHVNMPYTEAAISEVMRWRTIVPLNIMRYTLKDTVLNGYFIPKHTEVLAVLYAVDRDVRLWGNDVDIYKPERFLSKDGRKVVKPEYFIPFSIGKRSCPGKILAEVEVFLYVTAILQTFEISMPPGKTANLEGVLGVSLQPERQDICLKTRLH